MKTINKVSVMAVSAVAITLSFAGSTLALAATAPSLGVADSYAVFGKAGVTNNDAAGTTSIWGNVGADASVTNLNDGTQVAGTINIPAPGVQTAITAAFGALAGQAPTGALDLAGTNTVVPGVYTVGATSLNGTLTLNGAGVYIFQSSASIPVSPGANVLLTNGATACNVFWQIPASMTIGAGANMVGTIIADTAAITLGANATLSGRAFSSVAQVTLINNQITTPTCAVAPAVLPVTPVILTPSSTTPDIKVTKDADKSTLKAGPAKVTFTYKVTNEGNVALNDVSLKDDKCDDVDRVSGDINDDDKLDMNEEWKYRCTKTVKKTETNIATARGNANGTEVKDTDDFKVTVSTPGLPNAGFAPENFWDIIFRQVSSLF